MSLSDVRAEQLRMPRGSMAPLVAQSLNRRNRALIEEAIAALDVHPGQRVLDVGFGGALSLVLLAGAVEDGHVAGIDPSPEMVAGARRLLSAHLKRRGGRMRVEWGAAEAVPFEDGSFDRALTCQTIYFWEDLDAGLLELYRVLVPGGRLAVAMMPLELQLQFGFADRGYRVLSHGQLMACLERTGFCDVRPWPPPRSHPEKSWIVVAHRPADGGGR